jgi:type VI secretion system secreted protein VgrG
MLDLFNAESRFLFSSEKFDGTQFGVVKLDGYEAISQPFHFELQMVSTVKDIDFDEMLYSNATIKIRSHDLQTSVPYHGIVAEFEQMSIIGNFAMYRVVMVPRIWNLSLNKVIEVHLDEETIPDLIERILKKNNLSNAYKISMQNSGMQTSIPGPSGDYRKRSLVCQYQESDLTFISRLMETEGLYYYFEHESLTDTSQDAERLVITDYKESHSLSNFKLLRYAQPEDIQTADQDNCVIRMSVKQRRLPKEVVVRDYNYRKAALGDSLEGTADIDNKGHGIVMFFGENLRTTDEAGRIAKVRAEEIQSQGKMIEGDATAVGLRSGQSILVSNHYRSDFNDKFLVTEVKHEGVQNFSMLSGSSTTRSERGTVYTSHFKSIPANVQFRSPRVTPKPIIAGTLSAIIDDEGTGKYAQINEHGQYKVQFMYDYSEKSANKGSTWLRLMSPYAGPNNGMHFPLLKGTEVLIAFNGGDPDQPVILGAVTNSESENVVTANNNTKSGFVTPGRNVFSMDDQEGQQNIVISSPTGGATLFFGTINSEEVPVPVPAPPVLTPVAAAPPGPVGIGQSANTPLPNTPKSKDFLPPINLRKP